MNTGISSPIVQRRKQSYRKVQKDAQGHQEWSGGAGIWTGAAWLQNTAFCEVFHSLSTGTNAPTSFKLISSTRGLWQSNPH